MMLENSLERKLFIVDKLKFISCKLNHIWTGRWKKKKTRADIEGFFFLLLFFFRDYIDITDWSRRRKEEKTKRKSKRRKISSFAFYNCKIISERKNEKTTNDAHLLQTTVSRCVVFLYVICVSKNSILFYSYLMWEEKKRNYYAQSFWHEWIEDVRRNESTREEWHI